MKQRIEKRNPEKYWEEVWGKTAITPGKIYLKETPDVHDQFSGCGVLWGQRQLFTLRWRILST